MTTAPRVDWKEVEAWYRRGRRMADNYFRRMDEATRDRLCEPTRGRNASRFDWKCSCEAFRGRSLPHSNVFARVACRFCGHMREFTCIWPGCGAQMDYAEAPLHVLQHYHQHVYIEHRQHCIFAEQDNSCNGRSLPRPIVQVRHATRHFDVPIHVCFEHAPYVFANHDKHNDDHKSNSGPGCPHPSPFQQPGSYWSYMHSHPEEPDCVSAYVPPDPSSESSLPATPSHELTPVTATSIIASITIDETITFHDVKEAILTDRMPELLTALGGAELGQALTSQYAHFLGDTNGERLGSIVNIMIDGWHGDISSLNADSATAHGRPYDTDEDEGREYRDVELYNMRYLLGQDIASDTIIVNTSDMTVHQRKRLRTRGARIRVTRSLPSNEQRVEQAARFFAVLTTRILRNALSFQADY